MNEKQTKQTDGTDNKSVVTEESTVKAETQTKKPAAKKKVTKKKVSKKKVSTSPAKKKRGRGRPAGSYKPIVLPDAAEFTITDVMAANPEIRCRQTVMKAIARLVAGRKIKKTKNVRKFEKQTGRPGFLYFNPNFVPKAESEDTSLNKLATAEPVKVQTPVEPVKEPVEPEPEPEPANANMANA